MSCAVGGGRLSRHSGILQMVVRWMRDAGYGSVVREVLVPEWKRVRKDGSRQQAVLDIRAELHAFLPARWLDATVRVPGAEVYAPSASRKFGHAAAAGEDEKRRRYPAKCGMACTPLSVETFGALGAAFATCIAEWSSAASSERQSFGLPPRVFRHRWMSELSVCLAVHSAEAVLLACTVVRGDAAHA